MDINLTIVVILLILGTLDLTVGVANDAVNFLNSALGAKAGKFKLLLGIAALGVLVGVSFSSGMMEVARKGIFHPEHFLMFELLIIFVAVMFQDILLLDFFNTLGLPTSTTVSLVFGLFGGSLAISIIKISANSDPFNLIFEYINTGSVLTIVSAILFSIVLAFIFGALVQYITRMIFTFDFKERFKKYGSLWGSVALTSLSLFILIKGAKGSTMIPAETAEWIKSNIPELIGILIVAWVIILQILISFTKFNVLRFIVLAGTFALAMAFAANDLVNFIGAPLAGLHTYQIAQEAANPASASMQGLTQAVKAPTFILLGAGLIMIVTLFVSRKARTVANTTINLGRQSEGYEKFEANDIARAIVRAVLSITWFIRKLTPDKTKNWINSRFDLSKYSPEVDEKGDPQAFDMLRAAVILMVSAALISFATTLKLPLSTTYVTFIVAMAAALPDNAWGRESAVYRVSGVITVIGGWFFTALMASLVAGIIATLIYFAGFWGLGILIIFTAYALYRTKKSSEIKAEIEEKEIEKVREELQSPVAAFDNTLEKVSDYVDKITNIVSKSNRGLVKYKLKKVTKSYKNSTKLKKEGNQLIRKVLQLLEYTPEKEIESENSYMRVLSSFQEIAERVETKAKNNLDYIENNHHELTEDQINELTEVIQFFDNYAQRISSAIKFKNFSNLDEFDNEIRLMKKQIEYFSTQQLKRIKNEPSNFTRSLRFLNLLNDMKSVFADLYQIAITCKEIEIFLNQNLRNESVDLSNPTFKD